MSAHTAASGRQAAPLTHPRVDGAGQPTTSVTVPRSGAAIRRRAARGVILALLILAALPSAAFAHAQLLSTSPANNALLIRQPPDVTFTFGESVGIDGDAVRVFNSQGQRVDTGGTFHPGGQGPTVGVHLKPGLPRGTYTATYRVVSADTHIVTGGFVFSVGSRSSAPAAALSQLLSRQRTGPATETGFAAARAVQYAAIGIGGGLLAFLLFAWGPALAGAGLGSGEHERASERYRRRVRRLLAAVALAGLVSALAGIGLQGAEARGIDFWHALDGTTTSDVLPTRFGQVWGGGAIAWLVVLAMTALPLPRTRWWFAALGAPLVALLALPALAGHATIQHPIWLFAAANIIHVTAMTLWLGGLVGLVTGALTLPAGGDGAPEAGPRTLSLALRRFSPVALGCVIALIVTGTVQALIELSAWSQLPDTGYGRAILVKIGVLAGLVGLGALQQRRTMPAVDRDAAGESGRDAVGHPGRGTAMLLRTAAAELVALCAVLAAAGSLGGSAPGKEHDAAAPGSGPGSAMSGSMPGMAMSTQPGGPARTTTTIGAAKLAVTVTPATVGENTITFVLTDPATGRPFTQTKQLTVTATLTSKNIGPLTLTVKQTGPGRYTSTGAVLGAPGTWTLTLMDRTSEFDESQRSVQAQIN